MSGLCECREGAGESSQGQAPSPAQSIPSICPLPRPAVRGSSDIRALCYRRSLSSYPLLPGRAGMAAKVAGQCFLVGGTSSSSDELSIVKSMTSIFFLCSDVCPSWTGLYWRPVGAKEGCLRKRVTHDLAQLGSRGSLTIQPIPWRGANLRCLLLGSHWTPGSIFHELDLITVRTGIKNFHE